MLTSPTKSPSKNANFTQTFSDSARTPNNNLSGVPAISKVKEPEQSLSGVQAESLRLCSDCVGECKDLWLAELVYDVPSLLETVLSVDGNILDKVQIQNLKNDNKLRGER